MPKPPGPGESGHDLPTWSAYMQKRYERKFKRWINDNRKAGILPFLKGPYWPDADIDAEHPHGLLSDELEQQDG